MNQRGFGLIAYLVLGLAVLASISAIIWWADANIATSAGVKKGENSKQAEWDKANKDQREKEEKQASTAATKLEVSNVKARVVYRTITREVDKIVEKEVYRHVCFDADGVRLANAALRGEIAPPAKPEKPMPGPLPALRWERSLSVAEADRGG